MARSSSHLTAVYSSESPTSLPTLLSLTRTKLFWVIALVERVEQTWVVWRWWIDCHSKCDARTVCLSFCRPPSRIKNKRRNPRLVSPPPDKAPTHHPPEKNDFAPLELFRRMPWRSCGIITLRLGGICWELSGPRRSCLTKRLYYVSCRAGEARPIVQAGSGR
ncbi:hypothetical protein BGZ61DRAFT_240025 [Ilyonectria robusta]|uniref:uncharacterized protein n=1 Tax=Ilyonectria robusta TaxID=1079257 RepID=UPI001E8EE7FD|nr:uncharacterized protein BGZ61DRAFT_240025 [Ilyonectria robusta]KAH8699934.1 hypothetical protein BGZ61DRAFT_240025 [Ilyonectria robusta]